MSIGIFIGVFFPVLAAILLAALGGREERALYLGGILATGTVLLAMLLCALQDGGTLTLPVMGLTFTLGGFQRVYGLVVAFMWFIAALLSPQYFKGHHNLKRYYFFFVLCLGFTLGVFLSGDLMTTFTFFELMSLGSYVWVVQEETEGAIRAAGTYLAIAVLGGLVTLMGLFMLHDLTGTLVIAELGDACAAVENRGALWGSAVCILFGFAAKAGMFPLHIWLPKAHPVAPAPASALLSGVLTKAGIFGVLLITADILTGEHGWGVLLLVLGSSTMVLGAVMAVFGTDIKYILACSSLSQIGFITVGVSMLCLLGAHNALAAHGTVLYMMNHSLVKLTLFLFAGVVYCNTHALDLNAIRGFGRGKPLLHAVFLCGACSLAGVPGTLGYLSKTLVHEAIVEYAAETGSGAVTAVEWLFLFSGGLTAAYLLKMYVAIFWSAPAQGLHSRDSWGTAATRIALCAAAITLPALGLTPHAVSERIAAVTLPFTGGHPFSHAIHYFSWVNLKGVVISLGIGAAVYLLFIRRVLLKKGVYLDRWPLWLSLENSVYVPAIRGLWVVLFAVVHAICDLPDALILLLGRTVLRPSAGEAPSLYHRELHRYALRHRLTDHQLSDRVDTAQEEADRMRGSLSFGLLLTVFGLCAVLLYVILYVFW